MNKLINFLDSMTPMSAACKDYLSDVVESKNYLKREYLIRVGHSASHLWFIETGIVKYSYIKQDKDICSDFARENELVFPAESFLKNTSSVSNIQAIEDSKTYALRLKDLQYVFEHFPEFNLYGRIVMEKKLIAAEQRLFAMRQHTAIERYLFLLEKDPDLVRRVSNTDIASYLGISLETLSRLKNEL